MHDLVSLHYHLIEESAKQKSTISDVTVIHVIHQFPNVQNRDNIYLPNRLVVWRIFKNLLKYVNSWFSDSSINVFTYFEIPRNPGLIPSQFSRISACEYSGGPFLNHSSATAWEYLLAFKTCCINIIYYHSQLNTPSILRCKHFICVLQIRCFMKI